MRRKRALELRIDKKIKWNVLFINSKLLWHLFSGPAAVSIKWSSVRLFSYYYGLMLYSGGGCGGKANKVGIQFCEGAEVREHKASTSRWSTTQVLYSHISPRAVLAS